MHQLSCNRIFSTFSQNLLIFHISASPPRGSLDSSPWSYVLGPLVLCPRPIGPVSYGLGPITCGYGILACLTIFFCQKVPMFAIWVNSGCYFFLPKVGHFGHATVSVGPSLKGGWGAVPPPPAFVSNWEGGQCVFSGAEPCVLGPTLPGKLPSQRNFQSFDLLGGSPQGGGLGAILSSFPNLMYLCATDCKYSVGGWQGLCGWYKPAGSRTAHAEL